MDEAERQRLERKAFHLERRQQPCGKDGCGKAVALTRRSFTGLPVFVEIDGKQVPVCEYHFLTTGRSQ